MLHSLKSFIRLFTLLAIIIESIVCLPFGGTWKQIGFDMKGATMNDRFGYSVAMSKDGNTIVAGAPFSIGDVGQVRVFSYNVTSNIWIQVGSDINGKKSMDRFGWSVAMSDDGNTIAIGAILGKNDMNLAYGNVRVYSYNSTMNNWIQVGSDIDGEEAASAFGWSVAMSADGTTIAVGATFNTGNRGHVRVYSFNSTNNIWAQVGFDIDGEAVSDQSGYDVAMSTDGTMIAIGAINNVNANGAKSGHVRVYSSSVSPSRRWEQVGFDIDGEADGDKFGFSVAMSADGKTIVTGATGNDGNGMNAGHVRVHTINSTSGTWGRVGFDIDGEAVEDLFGSDVAISADGKTIAIGAPYGADFGQVRVYSINAITNSWIQVGSDIVAEGGGDGDGNAVAISANGTMIAIGAIYNGGGAGHVRIFQYVMSTKPPTRAPSKAITTTIPTKQPTTKVPSQITIPVPVLVPVAIPVPIQFPILVEPVNTSPSNCGVFGWNIFCPRRGKCGFWRRLLNLSGC